MNSTPINPAIVCVGFNRPDCLARLLTSVQAAYYPPGRPVSLVISLDRCDEEATRAALRAVAESIDWPHGDMQVITREARVGLKEHILACGDLTEKFGSIVLLEDDLLVGPCFHAWASQAAEFYAQDERIAGVALYSHAKNVCTRQDFMPLVDGHDHYFLRFTCSWGQLWTRAQWVRFRDWLAENPNVTGTEPLQREVLAWQNSWVKHHVKYLAETGRTVVYPRHSHATNFGDPGTNFSRAEHWYQVPVVQAFESARLSSLDETLAVYDDHFELDVQRLARLTPDLSEVDLVMDLGGNRDLGLSTAEFVLTTRSAERPERTWSDSMRPLELNLAHGIEGEGISLVRRDRLDAKPGKRERWFRRFPDFDREYTWIMSMVFAVRKVLRRLRGYR